MKAFQFSWANGVTLALAMAAGVADEPVDLKQVLKQIQELRAEQQRLQQTIAAQQQTIETLQKQVAAAEEKQKLAAEAAAVATSPQTPQSPSLHPPPTSSFRIGGGRAYMDISTDVLVAGGWSSEPGIKHAHEHEHETHRYGDGTLPRGHHDPQGSGFTLQGLELAFQGAVDPYVRGDVFVSMNVDNHGETTVELEEAYLTTLQMPWNLQLKGGQFYTEFGRLGTSMPHPHTWDFVDQPVIWSRMFGPDGLRNPGARVSWLAPTPFYLELFGAVQNSKGESAYSFMNTEEDEFAGRTLTDRDYERAEDLLYSTRLQSSFDLTREHTISVGASAAFGPNPTGEHARTSIHGADFYWKWRPTQHDHGWPFVKWTTEALWRDYDLAPQVRGHHHEGAEPEIEILPGESLRDWGFYNEVAWGFKRPWVAAFRVDYASGYDNSDPLLNQRWRFSPNLTYYFSEFSKLRLQYNADMAKHLDDQIAHGLWVQFEFLLGSHGAHKF
ncbi:MAG: hypothetical protein N2689_07945 [Verrucomicrobiae bacterium]|nr:hypothetical protein [Verrucomicrobiae bacterium]